MLNYGVSSSRSIHARIHSASKIRDRVNRIVRISKDPGVEEFSADPPVMGRIIIGVGEGDGVGGTGGGMVGITSGVGVGDGVGVGGNGVFVGVGVGGSGVGVNPANALMLGLADDRPVNRMIRQLAIIRCLIR